MSTPSKKALVIGAGFAGMSVATFLAKKGWLVTIIEKHNLQIVFSFDDDKDKSYNIGFKVDGNEEQAFKSSPKLYLKILFKARELGRKMQWCYLMQPWHYL